LISWRGPRVRRAQAIDARPGGGADVDLLAPYRGAVSGRSISRSRTWAEIAEQTAATGFTSDNFATHGAAVSYPPHLRVHHLLLLLPESRGRSRGRAETRSPPCRCRLRSRRPLCQCVASRDRTRGAIHARTAIFFLFGLSGFSAYISARPRDPLTSFNLLPYPEH